MVTPADLATFKQQIRQEMTDVIQQLRAEVNESINGRMDMLNSINAALQMCQQDQQNPSHIGSVTSFFPETGNAATKKESSGDSCQICTCGCKHGQTKERECLSVLRVAISLTTTRLHLIARMKSSDRLKHRCDQVLHRTTSNEPLRLVQQTRGQKGFEAWHAVVRRFDQRNTADNKFSNISEKDRTRDVEQLDDILRIFTNEMNKFENKFGKTRRDEKMLAVKKLMPDSLLNYRFRRTTMSYSELFIALENIIVDKVSTAPSSKSR